MFSQASVLFILGGRPTNQFRITSNGVLCGVITFMHADIKPRTVPNEGKGTSFIDVVKILNFKEVCYYFRKTFEIIIREKQ